MAVHILLLLLPLLFVRTTTTEFQSNHSGHVSLLVSDTGLDFAKDVLIREAVSTTIPLQLSDIERTVKIPLIGKVRVVLSDIQIYEVDIQSSSVDSGENGILLEVSGATADLSMNWSYTYTALFIQISDQGNASVKVEDMDMGLVVTLIERNGSLTISVLESYCNVKSIEIDVDGGASWLYQGVVDAFQKKLISAVENAALKKIREKIKKLESLLQSIPKEKKIDDAASVNLTFTGDPVLGDSSVEAKINGLFIPSDNVSDLEYYLSGFRPSFISGDLNRMVKISLEDKVFNSATQVYFNARRMHLVIDEIYNLSILNTADWKLILPELYRQYPDDKMKLNMSVTSPPRVKITKRGIDATIHLDTRIDVLDSGEVIPVAGISSVFNASCYAEISENNLAGSLTLVDFAASMKWSKFGNIHSNSVQAAMSRILEAAFFPRVNARLRRGFPLPIPDSFRIKGTEILYADAWVTVCSDVAST